MREGKMKRVTDYLTPALLLTCILAQTVLCFRLGKAGREGRTEARRTRVQEGKIVFGRVLDEGMAHESLEASSNSSMGDDSEYQADSPVLLDGQGPYDAAWKRMATSLQCGEDQMKLRVVGPGASQFALEQGKWAPPMPLSQIPSTCGYNTQANPFALSMFVPYGGCNVAQEGGSYVLPMLWRGMPVSLNCPKPTEQVSVPFPPESQVTVRPMPLQQKHQIPLPYWYQYPLTQPDPAPMHVNPHLYFQNLQTAGHQFPPKVSPHSLPNFPPFPLHSKNFISYPKNPGKIVIPTAAPTKQITQALYHPHVPPPIPQGHVPYHFPYTLYRHPYGSR